MDETTVAAGAAVFFTTLSQYLGFQQAEVASDILCWALLPFLFHYHAQQDGRPPKEVLLKSHGSVRKTSPALSMWIFAGAVGVLSFYRAESKTVGLVPAVVPLLVCAESRLRLEPPNPTVSDSRAFLPLARTTWGTALVACFSIVALTGWNIWACGVSAVAVAAMFTAYAVLLPREKRRAAVLPPLDVQEFMLPLSGRVLVILGIVFLVQTAMYGLPLGNLPSLVILGAVKALAWYYTIQTARQGTWCVAGSIQVFSIMSTRDPATASSDAAALAQTMSSFFALGQITHMLPERVSSRSVLGIFLLMSLVPYLINVFQIRTAQSSMPESFGLWETHPVEALVQKAKIDFDALLARQSRDYAAAHAEYRRRYGAEPPPGFEEWFNFAAMHKSPIIDDFDLIYDAVSPFWRLSGNEVLDAMRDAQKERDSELWSCTLSGIEAEASCTHGRRLFDRNIASTLNRLLSGLKGALPDVTLLVNHLDEPRVVMPNDGGAGLNFTNLSKQPTWDILTKNCEDKQGTEAPPINTFGVPFVTDRQDAMDLCRHPEYRDLHGLSKSPTSFRLVEGMLPVLSTGAPATMGDSLFPSPAYLEPEFTYDGTQDRDWEHKRNNLYWAGSTTGGYASSGDWHKFQRQRFVALAQNLGHGVHQYLRSRTGEAATAASSFLNGRLYDVTFTRFMQCDEPHCRDLRAYFTTKPWADRNTALGSRLVFDLDGNGISGRYYMLLASKSAPLKQTVLREWHDDRLVPWFHYVPMSQGLGELPELVLYLTSTSAGQQRAREIAEQGREWFGRALREVDMSIYLYRLLLELARLQDPERPALL